MTSLLSARSRAILWLAAFCCAVSGLNAGVYLTSYNFTTDNLPQIYTDESMPAQYRLRCKFQPGDYHATQGWNNNWHQLQSAPSPGTYTVETYWLKYDGNGNLLEIGPFTTTYNVTVSGPNSPPDWTLRQGQPRPTPTNQLTTRSRLTIPTAI